MRQLTLTLTLALFLALGATACLGVETEMQAPPDGAEHEPGEEASGANAGATYDAAVVADVSGAGIANPASVFCIEQGGIVKIETRPDGGEYGVCRFGTERQCEEWALLRGDCPIGGVEVTGYVTDASRFCAITGGEYVVTSAPDAETEVGTCTLPGGTVCDAAEYYAGECVSAGSG